MSFSLDVLQSEIKRDLTNEILNEMENYLDNSQLLELNRSINNHINRVNVYKHNKIVTDYDERNRSLVEDFLKDKALNGLSENSLNYYRSQLNIFLDYSNMLVLDYSPADIRDYLSFRKELHDINNITLNNYRRVLSSFYNYLYVEEYILRNPMDAVRNFKEPKRIKKPFSDEEIEIMRNFMLMDYDFRDIAIFELLLSSGIRLSECANINREDIDFNNRTFKVLGKGNKERICYFGVKADHALKEYLDTRDDDNPALFIAKRKKNGEYVRIHSGSIGYMIRDMGRSCGVVNAHPHRFRRTLASRLSKRKVPLDQIQKILGHDHINTTLIYVSVDSEDIKMNYEKHMK